MIPPTDAELLAAARTDASAFRALYDRYAARVLRYHQRRTSDADAAHDLTAETFAQAWLARRRFRRTVAVRDRAPRPARLRPQARARARRVRATRARAFGRRRRPRGALAR